MKYMDGMQVIESDIKDKVLKAMGEYDYNSYTAADVERALSHETCSCLLYTSYFDLFHFERVGYAAFRSIDNRDSNWSS